MRYRNNSQYKNDTEIRKRAYVSQAVLDELKRIVDDSEVGRGLGRSCGSLLLLASSGQRRAVTHCILPEVASRPGACVAERDRL